MICSTCNKVCSRIKIEYYNNKKYEYCNKCANIAPVSVPDVYFKGAYRDEHLANDKHPDGVFIESKAHKKRIMQEMGLCEAGDRVHGARTRYEKGFGERGRK